MELIGAALALVSETIGPFASQEELILTVAMLAFLVIGAYFVYAGISTARLMVAILRNRPIGAGEVAEAEAGIIEVQGRAEPLEKATDGGSESDTALIYEWRKEEITERHGDDNRDARNKTRTIDSDRHTEPFRVVDETGSVVVDPRGASLSLKERRITRGGPIQEYQADVKPGDSVHVYGEKRTGELSDGSGDVSHFVGTGPSVPEFVISDTGQFRTIFRKVRKSIGLFVLGALSIVISVSVLLFEVIGIASL